MQFQSLFLSVLIATSVAAKNKAKATSEKSQCKKMMKLEKFVTFASNTTKLDEVTKNNATKISEIQAEASAASQDLSTMKENTTLVADCAVINAQAMVEDQCQETFTLQRFVAFAENTTAVAVKTNNNETKIAAIQAKASQASAKLQILTSNSTLQAACPAVMQKDECKAMERLQKFVNNANNQTKLDKSTKGNSTKAEEIKAEAAQAQTRLTEWTNNETFMAACASMGMTNTGKDIDSGSTQEATSGKKSVASMISTNTQFTILSTILVVAVGMLSL